MSCWGVLSEPYGTSPGSATVNLMGIFSRLIAVTIHNIIPRGINRFGDGARRKGALLEGLVRDEGVHSLQFLHQPSLPRE